MTQISEHITLNENNDAIWTCSEYLVHFEQRIVIEDGTTSFKTDIVNTILSEEELQLWFAKAQLELTQLNKNIIADLSTIYNA